MPIKITNETMMIKRLYFTLPNEYKNIIAKEIGRNRKKTIEEIYLDKYHTLPKSTQEVFLKYINLFLGTHYTVNQLTQTELFETNLDEQ